MIDKTFFTHPKFDWQRRYETLRATIVERMPAKVVADRFGYQASYVRLLKHQFKRGLVDFSEPVSEEKAKRRGVSSAIRQKIREWREQSLSAGQIVELLSEDGLEISVRTVERVIVEEGFPKLPRRTRLKIGITVTGAKIPDRSEPISIRDLHGQSFESPGAGVFLFAPFLAQLNLDQIIKESLLPGTKVLSAKSYLLSFLSLKLLGNERYAHVGDHSFDPGTGLYVGLNALPKCTAMSTYSYSLDTEQITALQRAFVSQASRLRLYDGKLVNLDFQTIPHYGDESVLEKHWAGARGKVMKGALTLFAQDAGSKLLLYTPADIMRDEADDQVLEFLSFWKSIHRGVLPTFVFDSRFTTYPHLSKLNARGVKFLTLRRRGTKLLRDTAKIEDWKRIQIPHDKRKFPNPLVHESMISLRGYEGQVRQVIMKGNGHEKPAFIIGYDLNSPVESIVGNYARRWRVENGIAEAVKFFHLNSLSSPILTKVHFDIVMTAMADTLYSMLAKKLRGFEDCDAPKIYRNFVRGKATVSIQGNEVTVTYPHKAHNPILRTVPWGRFPATIPGCEGAKLVLEFK
ncbi:transposase [Bdellovibrionota bacterium FG-2]